MKDVERRSKSFVRYIKTNEKFEGAVSVVSSFGVLPSWTYMIVSGDKVQTQGSGKMAIVIPHSS